VGGQPASIVTRSEALSPSSPISGRASPRSLAYRRLIVILSPFVHGSCSAVETARQKMCADWSSRAPPTLRQERAPRRGMYIKNVVKSEWGMIGWSLRRHGRCVSPWPTQRSRRWEATSHVVPRAGHLQAPAGKREHPSWPPPCIGRMYVACQASRRLNAPATSIWCRSTPRRRSIQSFRQGRVLMRCAAGAWLPRHGPAEAPSRDLFTVINDIMIPFHRRPGYNNRHVIDTSFISGPSSHLPRFPEFLPPSQHLPVHER
jgi:hypothetical protein